MKSTVSEYVILRLQSFGVVQAFCVTGGASSHLMESLRTSSITTIHNHHEQACSMAADGYARIAKIPALVLCTNGPGVTNLITGVAGAFQDSIPMFVITGQVPSKYMMQNSSVPLRQLGVQEIDTAELANSICKKFFQILEPHSAINIIEEALRIMMEGRRGPVWIEIPLDIQSMIIEIPDVDEQEHPVIPKIQSNHSLCNEIQILMDSSVNPIIVVGNGVHLSGTENIFLELVKKLRIPVISTWSASDLFSADDDLYIGNFGILGQRAANYLVQYSDLIIIIGSRLSIPNIGYSTELFAPKAKKIMIDIDENEIRKESLNIDLEIVSNLEEILPTMVNEISLTKSYENWLGIANKIKEKLDICHENRIDDENYMDSYTFIELLSPLVSTKDIIVTDMGTSFTCTMQAFKNNAGNRLFTSSGTSSMGFGLPGALGAAAASTQNGQVICIAGDGGFQMNIQELQTVVDNNLNIKIFVLDSCGYLAISIMQDNSFEGKHFGSTKASGIGSPDFVKIASAYGIPATYLSPNYNLSKSQLSDIIKSEGPHLCVIKISQLQTMRPRLQSRRDSNGQFLSGGLEYMWPYIEPDLENIIHTLLNQIE